MIAIPQCVAFVVLKKYYSVIISITTEESEELSRTKARQYHTTSIYLLIIYVICPIISVLSQYLVVLGHAQLVFSFYTKEEYFGGAFVVRP